MNGIYREVKEKYQVKLINDEGCTFDSGYFESLKECREFSKGRGTNYQCEIYTHGIDGDLVYLYLVKNNRFYNL